MTRLFLRFYIGVLIILALASVIQGYVMWFGAQSQNAEVFKQMNFGGLRVARDQMAGAAAKDVESTFDSIQASFDFPVEHVRFDDLPENDWLRQRLISSEPEFLDWGAGISFNKNTEALLFGPFPDWFLPRQSLVLFALGIVLLFAGLAIAVLLRPVVKQLRSVERTAIAIAGGDLSARIEGRSHATSVPIASAFNLMAERTETLLKSQRELLQAVSHELRTPLARIRFATELVESAQTDEQRKGRLESIDQATEQLDLLVGELLSYVRLDSDSVGHELETVNLAELLSDVVEIHSPLHPDIEFDNLADPALVVEADRNSLTRAIGNLVSNAGRHAKSLVLVSASEENGAIVIRVDDDGEGIAEADRDKLFEPFVRLESSKGKGSGLGLALVKRIVSRHSGDVCVSSSDSGGARFEIRLPLTKSSS